MADKAGKPTRSKGASATKRVDGKPSTDSTNVLISVDDQHLSNWDEVVEGVRGAGLENVQPLRSIGTITGTIAGDRKSALSRIPGVRSVEAEAGYQLPPPESDVQ